MKIAINGDIIDTKNIYKITEITKGCGYGDYTYKFDIISFKNKYTTIFLCDNLSESELNKITKFRDSIIKIWSENQPNIPQFNL